MDSTSVKIARHATERIATLEQENFQLRLENVGLREANAGLSKTNSELRRDVVVVIVAALICLIGAALVLT